MRVDPVEDLPGRVRGVLNFLQARDIPYQLRHFDEPAHRASQASELLGCELGAVVKSLVFASEHQDEIYLLLISGANRVDLENLTVRLGVRLTPAVPDVVLLRTGYPVGSVPPFGFEEVFPVIIDADLMDFPFLWASAGESRVLVRICSRDLPLLTRGQILQIH
jgi:prolyl-tRNA editing enzyme YbaK/EbsC (Cys-tRNA(Pro) deacylase)